MPMITIGIRVPRPGYNVGVMYGRRMTHLVAKR